MQHKLLEAKAATTTDLGEFEAIAAAYSVDRVNERIAPGAFTDTIKAWRESGKQIPLHWNHSGDAEDIIGTIDPKSMKEVDGQGLFVKGKLDLGDSDVAKAAWRSMKADRVGLSFGYMVQADSVGEDGVRELKKLDLYEITITPMPANPDTRFIDLKSLPTTDEAKDEIKAMRERLDAMEGAISRMETEHEEKMRDAEGAALAERFIALHALKNGENLDKAEAESSNKPTEPEEVEDPQTRSESQVSGQGPSLVGQLRSEIAMARLGAIS